MIGFMLIVSGATLTLSLVLFPIIIHDAYMQSVNPYKEDIEKSATQVNNLISLFSGVLLCISLMMLILQERNLNDKDIERLRS